MSMLIVRVKPGSKKGPLIQPALDGSLLVYVREPAVDGKANAAVTKLIAKYLRIPQSKLKIKSGQTSRIKYFEIS